jgi:hypothetical protein
MTEKENAAQQTVWTAPRIVRLGNTQNADKAYPNQAEGILTGVGAVGPGS